MQELEPSPVDESFDLAESGEYFPQHGASGATSGHNSLSPPRRFKGRGWDFWLSTIQRYSTYPPTVFLGLHIANTSLLPLVTRSVPDSEQFLLLTRPIYQAPSLEPFIVTIPIVAHVISGIALRRLRSKRRARLYGAESTRQRHLIPSWPKPSLQARLGYATIPLIGLHVLVNRAVPLAVDGGSSAVGLGYVAHGFVRSPSFWTIFYVLFVAVSVWHFVGGWAAWLGFRVTTARKAHGDRSKSLSGILGRPESMSLEESRRKRRAWWTVYGLAGLTTAVWLMGGLGVVARGGPGSGWEASTWDQLYKSVPVIGGWL